MSDGAKGFKKIGNTVWLHFGGRTYTIQTQDGSPSGSKKKRGNTAALSGILTSPMPGKILKVNVEAGAMVTQGQTVCVIEAMKMEYALKAPFEGRVKSVSKKTGDQVVLDERILEIDRKL